MAERIQASCPYKSDWWLPELSPGRQAKVKETIDDQAKADTFVSKILATQFADKAHLIVKLRLLECTKKELKREFRRIEKLRNSLAHANAFAATKDAAERVPDTVNAILSIMAELRK